MITRTEMRIKLGSDNVASVCYYGRRYRRSATESGRRAALRLAEKVALAERADSAVVENYHAKGAGLAAATLVMTLTLKPGMF